MKVYKTQDIRNVAILGHGGCGKTSLVEAMAHVTELQHVRDALRMEIPSAIMIKKKSVVNFQSVHLLYRLNGNSGRLTFRHTGISGFCR